MKVKHHIFRIFLVLVNFTWYIIVLSNTEKLFWCFVWLFLYLFICCTIIAIDEAKEINDENMDL